MDYFRGLRIESFVSSEFEIMKKLILLVEILLLASIAFLRLYDRYSPESIQQRQNVENIYKVRVGVSEDTVASIMGGRGLVILPVRNFPFH